MSARYLLVDGHSVIFSWTELRALHQKKPAQAREVLIKQLQELHDTSFWKVTLVFDGRFGSPVVRSPCDMVVAYSTEGQSADSIIEQLVGTLGVAPQILVITADEAEKRTIEALGAEAASPDWLKQELDSQQKSFKQAIDRIKKKAKW
jgi:predicted RNA-binding protein with PIN domain